MKVLFFAQSRQIVGADFCTLPVEQSLTQEKLWALLEEKFSALAPLRKTARLARNETYLRPGELLEPGDEIAIIPPVSGG